MKLEPAETFFNCGVIDLGPDQMKRSKNSRKMHMFFNVQSGTVEVKVAENEFTVHRNGIWQVPRGKLSSLYSLPCSPNFLWYLLSCPGYPGQSVVVHLAVAICHVYTCIDLSPRLPSRPTTAVILRFNANREVACSDVAQRARSVHLQATLSRRD
jgi:hypothetical protein